MELDISWKLKDHDRYLVDKKSNIWRVPFNNKKRWYKLKQIHPHVHQGKIKYLIDGKRLTENQIDEISIPCIKKIEVKNFKPFSL